MTFFSSLRAGLVATSVGLGALSQMGCGTAKNPSHSLALAEQPQGELVHLTFTGRDIDPAKILAFRDLTLEQIVERILEEDPTIMIVSKDLAKRMPSPQIVGGEVEQYYRKIVLKEEDDGSLAFFIEPYFDLDDEGFRRRPYLDRPVIFCVEGMKREYLIHEYIHYLIYRSKGESASREVDGQRRAVSDLRHGTILRDLNAMRRASGVAFDAEEQGDEATIAAARRANLQSRITLQIHRTEWLRELSGGEELDVTRLLHAYRNELGFDFKFQVTNLWYHQSIYTRFFFDVLGPMAQTQSYVKEKIQWQDDKDQALRAEWEYLTTVYDQFAATIAKDKAWYTATRAELMADPRFTKEMAEELPERD